MQVVFLTLLFICNGDIQAAKCPHSNKKWFTKLEQLSDSLVPDLGNNTLYKNGPKLLSSTKYLDVINFWKRCSKKSSTKIKIQFQNILKHSQFMAKSQRQGHTGFLISDEEYLLQSLATNQRFAEFPKVFFENNYLPKKWKSIIQDCAREQETILCQTIKDWKFIDFVSTLEDGSGNHKRVIVQIPHKNFQQYFLFFPDHPKYKKSNLVDIIALQTNHLETGLPLQKKRPFFFERHNKGFAKDGGRCISCHPNGLREIIPMQGSIPSLTTQNDISKFNKEVKFFGKPDWQGLFNREALGPPIGGSCLECHSTTGRRSPLTIFTKPSLIRSKVYELEMPFPRLYSLYFEKLKKIKKSDNKTFQNHLKTLIANSKALPEKDYRTSKQIRNLRKEIHKILFNNNKINNVEYLWLRALDNTSSLHIDHKLNHLFEDHKRELKVWLMGNN